MLSKDTYIAETSRQNKKQLVEQRMASARVAKARKKINRQIDELEKNKLPNSVSTECTTLIDTSFKRVWGKAVDIGERGARFYINKNGNRTYLSSNQ